MENGQDSVLKQLTFSEGKNIEVNIINHALTLEREIATIKTATMKPVSKDRKCEEKDPRVTF